MANLLLIDDEEDLVDLIRFELERRGHTIEACTDGNEAIKRIKAKRYDLVITDLRMPDADGLAICQTVHQCYGAMPVIVLSGNADAHFELDALGVKHRLRKPFPLASLAALITQLTAPAVNAT